MKKGFDYISGRGRGIGRRGEDKRIPFLQGQSKEKKESRWRKKEGNGKKRWKTEWERFHNPMNSRRERE